MVKNNKRYKFIHDFDQAKEILKKVRNELSRYGESEAEQESSERYIINDYTDIYSSLAKNTFVGLLNDFDAVVLDAVYGFFNEQRSDKATEYYRQLQIHEQGAPYKEALRRYLIKQVNDKYGAASSKQTAKNAPQTNENKIDYEQE